MLRRVSFPFPEDRFPAELGAVIQRTVLEGERPARYVAHTYENEWIVGDDVDDPNLQGASIAAHIRHVVDRDPALEVLATLPAGFQARRASTLDQWEITPFAYLGEDETFTPG